MADEKALGLQHNPFWILGATTRDDVHRIVTLAEEKALHLDDEVCRRARADLTSPKFRLAAEIGWFPALDPARVAALLGALAERHFELADDTGLPTLARVNLMAAVFLAVGQAGAADVPVGEAAGRILKFAHLVDAIDSEAVLRDINQDRARSGFAAVRGTDQVDAELVELRRRHRATLRDVLDAMPAETLVGVMQEAVRVDTERGTRQATRFLDRRAVARGRRRPARRHGRRRPQPRGRRPGRQRPDPGLRARARRAGRAGGELAKRPASRRALPGIKASRADIVLGAAVVLEAVLEHGGFDGIEVTRAGLREGVFSRRGCCRLGAPAGRRPRRLDPQSRAAVRRRHRPRRPRRAARAAAPRLAGR